MSLQNLLRVCARRRGRLALLSTALLPLTVAVLAGGARASSGEVLADTFPASVSQAGLFADAGTGERPSISADGRYIAFVSAAANLGEHGPTGVSEAYVKDLQTGEVALVSRANGIDGEPANEPGEGSGVERVLISGDGRYAIFTSDASNLVAGLPATGEPVLHLYRRDLQTGETVLVDRVSGAEGAIPSEGSPRVEGVSDEGRYVLFRDEVEGLEAPAGAHEPGLRTLYVRDLQTGTTTAVSRASGPEGELADEDSRVGSISPDGQYVAFESSATNLVPGMEANSVSQIYLRDLQTDTTRLASEAAPSEAMPGGEPGNGSSEEPIVVGEGGCEVAYTSSATNLYLLDGSPIATPQVYLTDLCPTPIDTTLVSRADGADGIPAGEGNAVVPFPLGASADGRYILFSAFSELTGEASPSARVHLYVREVLAGRTMLIDRASGADGELADASAEDGAIAANGCRVAFSSSAEDLAEPTPPASELETYVRQLSLCQVPAEEEHHQEAGKTVQAGEQSHTSGQSVTATPVQRTVQCVVPVMRALRLQVVERKLSAAHCRLGHVVHHYSKIPNGGLVEQSLHQGTIRPAGTKVDVWLSKGAPHRRRARSR
jgi:dipeptidyl aminopeptidase/acylaminoacyl peptidase